MVTIAHASISEDKTINGKRGDQTGKEVCLRSWWSKPWNVLIRFIDPDMQDKVAEAMEKACANDHIGYSQNDRNSLLNAVRKYGYDPECATSDVNTDCSALVTVACIYAGIAECALVKGGNCATTRTLKSLLKATGEVMLYTTADYLNKTDKLKRGDILLKEGSHVVVVVSGEAKSVFDVAREVIQGKWGNGAERKRLITEAYKRGEIMGDYEEVQKAVKELIHGTEPVTDVPKHIWDYLYKKIGNPYGVAGLMGNLKAESNFNPRNLQNSYEKKLGFTDDTYTTAVDSGAYQRFCNDKAGYGLAQWTSDGRKKALYEYRKNRSIGDLDMQLDFLWKELSTSYKGVLNGLKLAETVREASDLVLTKFERPKDQSVAVQVKRAGYGKDIYDKYYVV